MRLHGPQSRFELSLVGSRDLEGWCGVRVFVDGPDGHWTATSRCLMSGEVIRVANWLERAARDPSLYGKFAFHTLDNMINFELLRLDPRQLRIYLEWDLRRVKDRDVPMEEFYRDYPVSTADLQRAADSLREELYKNVAE